MASSRTMLRSWRCATAGTRRTSDGNHDELPDRRVASESRHQGSGRLRSPRSDPASHRGRAEAWPSTAATREMFCPSISQSRRRRHKKLGGIFASAAARGPCLRPVLQCKNLRFHRGL
jgi:hypothetical protein